MRKIFRCQWFIMKRGLREGSLTRPMTRDELIKALGADIDLYHYEPITITCKEITDESNSPRRGA